MNSRGEDRLSLDVRLELRRLQARPNIQIQVRNGRCHSRLGQGGAASRFA